MQLKTPRQYFYRSNHWITHTAILRSASGGAWRVLLSYPKKFGRKHYWTTSYGARYDSATGQAYRSPPTGLWLDLETLQAIKDLVKL